MSFNARRFTEKNGATLLLEDHLSPNKPNEEDFYKNSKDLQAKQVMFFCLMEMRGMLLVKTRQQKKSNVTPIFCRRL